ncbi:aminotransferase class I/II-fold pyridoxal phosphate-dependent enzyme [Metabacillus sp. cB07]|uniref:DegT/DnrJ/EryC1/StrS family aminotransferase n=1 Tax=Metabacillus sp. cB07 TaxID=2806989 RepID=UPI00193A46DE|nr:aminotransferase class I/II-fold pyridoxal phosphate-dependent enzyme [Metabacillus sp. cB07]
MKHELTRSRIFLSPPHMSGNELKYINRAFESNWIAPLGPNVDEFEKEIASYVGVRGAVAVSSGTAAIHLALSILGVTKGDIVFCSTLTFVASANPILYQDASPVFIDSEPETWNMSPIALEKALVEAKATGQMPKAVIVVNLYGQVAKMDEIISLCNLYNVPIIEDAAESLGSTYKGYASGSFGDFGIFSFNGNKIITTSGGGMLVSDNLAALEKARFLATQAKDPALHYQHSSVGFNYRMSNILAGIGISQLEVLNQRVNSRRSVYERYFKELSDIPGIYLLPELDQTFSNRWLTALCIEEESNIDILDLINMMAEENIEIRPIWKPLHLQPLFHGAKYFSHYKSDSISEKLFNSGVCLPSGSNLTEKEQLRVINCIKKAAKVKCV